MGARGEWWVELDIYDGLGGSEHEAGGLTVQDAQERRAVLGALGLVWRRICCRIHVRAIERIDSD